MIVIGTDTHKRTHALSAVDEGTGKVRGSREIEADEPGHLAAVDWARGLDEERVWAIEDCRHVSRRLRAGAAGRWRAGRARGAEEDGRLQARRARARQVRSDRLARDRPRGRQGRRRPLPGRVPGRAGDGDPPAVRSPRRTWSPSAPGCRTGCAGICSQLCPELERSLKRGSLSDLRQLDRVDRRLRRLGTGARVRVAREQLAQIRALTRQADALERELRELIGAYRPGLLAERGCGDADRGAADRPDRRRRAVPLRRELRPPVGHRADPVLLRAANPVPPRPRRGPPAQPGAAHHRDHPRQPRPRNPGVPRSQTSRGQDQEGRAALPQAPPRQTLLAAAHRTTARARAGRRIRARREPIASEPITVPERPAPRREVQRIAGCGPDGLHHLAASPARARADLRPAATTRRTTAGPRRLPRIARRTRQSQPDHRQPTRSQPFCGPRRSLRDGSITPIPRTQPVLDAPQKPANTESSLT